MLIYSPTSTERYLTCPLLWKLKQEWEPRELWKPSLARVVGSGVGVGVGRYYHHGRTLKENASLTGKYWVEDELVRLKVAGHTMTPDIEEDTKKLPDLVAKSILKYIANDPMPLEWSIGDIEGVLPSKSRTDWVATLPSGEKIIWDLKVKRTLDDRYLQSTFDEYRQSWQMRHYLWEYSESHGERVREYGIVLVRLSPFKIFVDRVSIDDESLDFWLQGAKQVWNLMEQGYIWQAASHRNRYGRCEMWNACLECRLDEGLMAHGYVRKEKGK